MQIEELCSMTLYPNGLYLFFNEENELLYVGKATSRSFIERIPAHFDQREEAWFNSLPKKIKSIYKTDYTVALEMALSFYLVIIGVKEPAVAIKLENILRYHFQPKLNFARNNSFLSTNKLSAILSF